MSKKSREARRERRDAVNVETPNVETPNVETPNVETPNVETPNVETPNVETPNVETVETPNVETVETPNVETPNAVRPTNPAYTGPAILAAILLAAVRAVRVGAASWGFMRGRDASYKTPERRFTHRAILLPIDAARFDAARSIGGTLRIEGATFCGVRFDADGVNVPDDAYGTSFVGKPRRNVPNEAPAFVLDFGGATEGWDEYGREGAPAAQCVSARCGEVRIYVGGPRPVVVVRGAEKGSAARGAYTLSAVYTADGVRIA